MSKYHMLRDDDADDDLPKRQDNNINTLSDFNKHNNSSMESGEFGEKKNNINPTDTSRQGSIDSEDSNINDNSESTEKNQEERKINVSLKKTKQKNPLQKGGNEEVKERFQYIPPPDKAEEEHNNTRDRRFQESQLQSSSNTRSTLPLNPFYGEFISHIKAKRFDSIRQILEECPHQFYGGVDEMHKTILHGACEKNSIEVVKIIIQYLFDGNKMITSSHPGKVKLSRMDFINKQNLDGLTAIHYASFRGNIEIIEYLIKLGGNPFIKDNDGHNVIHIAAQGDKVNVIYYFTRNFKFDVNDRDNKESSALHWAAYLDKEIALTYLIAWGANVNSQDTELNTPLHLAVLTAQKTNETRCVKILLLKGANRSLQNKDNQAAIDLVSNCETKNELLSILKDQKYGTCMMLKVPLTKIDRNERTVIFFIGLFLFMTGITGLYILKQCKKQQETLSIIFGVLGFLQLLSFACAALISPGYIKRDPNIDFQELLNQTDHYNIGPDCKIIRTPRSRHGNICNRCVERFDHHCPYLNNGVGYRNHFFFLMFIFFLVLNMSFLGGITLYAIISKPHKHDAWPFLSNFYHIEIFYLVCVIIIVIGGFFLPFTSILSFVHGCNFLSNKTTNERFSRKNEGDNNSVLSKSMLDRSDNTSHLLGGSNDDTLLRTTFMGPKNGSGFGNGYRMLCYSPPSQNKMKNEYLGFKS